MKRTIAFLCVAYIFVAPVQAQLPPEKAKETFTVSDGLEFTLWASEPLFVNPTCMDIDHKGRVWVVESINYRDTLRRQPIKRPEGDRILILEDSTGAGKADKATVFYQAKEILAPLGIAVAKDPIGPGYKVYVCQSPDILLFEDKDGDGKADGPPTKLLSGFRGIDHDHGVHGILIGPDMKLYFSVGDQGVTGLVDKNGKKWTTNDTDCRAGTIWRCDLDGKNLELIAHNFRNEYEPCVDSFGNIFVSDNDDDGNQQTRICYVMPGGNYGYHPRGPGQSHWHEEQPGVVHKILRTYFGSPTGMCVYEGTLLPKKYWGQLLHTDAGPRHVRCYHLKPEGAGFDAKQEDMVSSTDNWFRPSDVCVAPDGSVYVADWYDPGVGGHGMGDITRGRIYRLAPKGNKPSVPKVDLETKEGVLAALGSPALSVRYMAMAKLNSPDPVTALENAKKVYEILRSAVEQKDNLVLRARALTMMATVSFLSTLQGTKPASQYLVESAQDPDPQFRILSLRLLENVFDRENKGVYAGIVAKDPSAAVRREALLSAKAWEPEKVKAMLPVYAASFDGKDHFYLAAIGIAVGTDPKRRDIILADFDKQFPNLDEKTLGLIFELRPPGVLPRLQENLADATVPADLRGKIVDILASNDDPKAGIALLKTLQTGGASEVKDRAAANLRLFLPGKWRSLRGSPELAEAVANLIAKPASRSLALGLIGAADRTQAVAEVSQIARDAKESAGIRSAAIQTLGALSSEKAVAALAELLNAEPAALRVEVVQALGKHAQQRPRNAGPDQHPALVALEKLVLTSDRDIALRIAATEALAASRPGTEWFLDLHKKQQLPADLRSNVGRLLRNSPYQDLRNRALVAFPAAVKLDPAKLPSPAALANRHGDAKRGMELLALSAKNDTQCLKCHKIQGAGGSIGTDLSVIGSKGSRENLFESILLPSKAIADQYVTWLIETKKGEALSGLVIEETPEFVLLRDANGKDTKIGKKEIESRAKSPTSLMPSDLLAYMTEDDLVDIVEYLFSLKGK